jgi:iron(III) transport system ATP-binding protein
VPLPLGPTNTVTVEKGDAATMWVPGTIGRPLVPGFVAGDASSGMARSRTTGSGHPTGTSGASVVVDGVAKAFDGRPALRAASLIAEPGSILSILGPSGCGKTTLLRTVAGLERPDAGSIVVDDRALSAPGVFIPPERRAIGMVFQDWALFPHLTVAANVAYGLPRSQRHAGRVEEALRMVGLRGFDARMPGTLSGGQQQRVALARALAPRPRVLLLDEPFSNLDASLRSQVRGDLHRLLAELAVTTLFVTHDQDEAFMLGDAVAVMRDGEVVQIAPAVEVYRRPVSPWVASFVGEANILDGEGYGDAASTALGAVPLAGRWEGLLSVLVRPEDIQLEPDGSGVVLDVEYHGHDTVTVVAISGMSLRVRQPGAPRFARGSSVAVAHRGPPTAAWPRSSSAGDC